MPLPKPPRRSIPEAIRRQVVAFYEGDPAASEKCVLTDVSDDVQFHHLDENPARSEAESNLLPLAGELNREIERRPLRLVPPVLGFDRLSDRSGRCYAQGRYSYAYGASMLGVTLAWNVPAAAEPAGAYFVRPDTAGFFCANALVSLRPLNRLYYASDLLSLYVVPLLSRYGAQIERHTCARLAMEIGSYFRDAADYRHARGFVRTARMSLRQERRSDRTKTLLARLWQHEGITALAEGNSTVADDCFKRAADETTIDYSIGVANDRLYHVHMLLRASPPRIEEAQHIVARYHEGTNPLFVTKWTEIELRLADAQSHYQRRDAVGKREAFARVRRVLQRLTAERIVPTSAVFPPVLRAFADEYPTHRLEVQMLDRRLPAAFRRAALGAHRILRELSTV